MTSRLTRAVAALLLLSAAARGQVPPAGAAPGATPQTAATPFSIAISAPLSGAGEVGFFDADGRRVGRLTGFVEPVDLAPSEDDRFFVLDRAAGRVLEVDIDGRVWWEVKTPRSNPYPERLLVLEGGGVLLWSEYAVTDLDRDGNVVASFDAPRGARLLGVARLSDGSTVVSLVGASAPVLRYLPGAGFSPLMLPEGYAAAPGPPRIVGEARPAQTFVVAQHDFAVADRVRVEGVRLVGSEALPLPLTVKLTADPRWGAVTTSEPVFTIRRFSPDGSAQFTVPFLPLGALYLPGRGLYAISYVRVRGAVWPDSWKEGGRAAHFPWGRFALYFLGGVLVGTAVFVLRGRPAPSPPASVPPAVETAPAPLPPSVARRAVRLGVAFVPLALYAAAFVLARKGLGLLGFEFRPWLDAPLLAGFGLALAASVWDRIATRRRDPYWEAVLAAPVPDRRLLLALAGGAAAVVAGLVVLYRIRAAHGNETDAASLWASLHAVLLGMVAASFRGRVRLSTLSRHAVVLVPVAIASLTLTWRLFDAPANIHFDFVYNSLSALELLDGRLASIFEPGFVPVPVIGLIPEMAGFVLAGPTPFGFRLGPVLAGVGGVAALYLLGATWRGRATGLLGAIFLAGAVPWIHFSRLSSNGVSASAGLLAVALGARALKRNGPGWWLLGGSVAGWCFYLWPASRVAPVACFLAGVVLALRAPRATARRWAGPPLMAIAFAVWVVPLVPAWRAAPNFALPRAQESLEVYKPNGGLNRERLAASFGTPLAMSAGWLFSTPDQSSQGSMSPALNPEEGALVLLGVASALAAGFSLNVLLLLYLGLVFVFLGAFAGSPPWYTRLLPSLPAACVFAGFAGATLLDFLRLRSARARNVALALAAAAVTVVSPLRNVARYVAYECGSRPLWEATAIGRTLRELGRGRTVYFITTGRSDWSLNVATERPPRLGEMLPFVWDLRLVEIRELDDALPLPPGPKAVVVPAARVPQDVPRLLAEHPRAKVEDVPGAPGLWAKILVID